MKNIKLSTDIFINIKNLIFINCGLNITVDKKELLAHKLHKRVVACNLKSYDQYYSMIKTNSNELQNMINTVTTNETSFFRESVHFEYIKNNIIPNLNIDKLKCWSAAGSIGAEVYSMAMTIDHHLPAYKQYELICSDINSDVLQSAKQGIYNISLSNKIPNELLKKYCLQGYEENSGLFTISQKLKKNITFLKTNLVSPDNMNKIEEFDIIFLRNMIIYFDKENKKRIVENVIKRLKVGGHLFMGHSESLNEITTLVKQIQPSIYQKI